MADTASILGFGEPMVEYNQTREGDGRMFLRGIGGDVSNTMIAAARQGASTAMITALGDDDHGAVIREVWSKEGVDDRHVRLDRQALTGVYFVTHDADGHHFSYLRKGSAASRYQEEDLPLEAFASARILHLSGISLGISASACDAGFAAMHAARKAGVLVSFDTNLRRALWGIDRARAVIDAALGLADIVLPSLEDMVALHGEQPPEAFLDHCLAKGAGIVGLKLGSKGALVATAKQRDRIQAHPVEAVDATGAGDTFGGALLARLLLGDPVEVAGRYAAVAAGLATTGYGAISPIPRSDQVQPHLTQEPSLEEKP